MQIVALFSETLPALHIKHDLDKCLEGQGNTIVVPLYHPDKQLVKEMLKGDYYSLLSFDVSMILATALAVIGASYGFIFYGGPIIWGIIGALSGAFTGFLISKTFLRNRLKKETFPTGIYLYIITCPDSFKKNVLSILVENHILKINIL